MADRFRHIGLVARFSIVGLTVSLLVAAGMAWFVESQVTSLLLANVAARAGCGCTLDRCSGCTGGRGALDR
jgi:hypothetical protein